MKQRHLQIIAVLIALLLPMATWADALKNGDTFVVDGITYQYSYYSSSSEGPYLSVYNGYQKPAIDASTTGSITIPAEVTAPDGASYPVKIIGGSAFYECTGITSVTLPSTITQMVGYSFYGCTGLTSINIPSSVWRLAGRTFYGCSSLASFTIPESVTEIYMSDIEGTAWYNSQPDGLIYKDGILFGEKGDNATSGSVNVKDGTRVIAGSALSGNQNITSVTIPSSVTHIGESAFNGTGIKSITIPKTVKSISQAFIGCKNLESIVVESGNERYESPNGCNAILSYSTYLNGELDKTTAYLALGCKNTVIPDDLRYIQIGSYAFSGCTGLTSINIPGNVESIGGSAFSGCTGLTSIEIPHSVTSLGDRVFVGCSGLKKVTIGKGLTRIDSDGYCFASCPALTEVYSYIREPFAIKDSNFPSSTYTGGTLYVPTGTKDKYQAADGWKNFANIVEQDDLMVPLEVDETFVSDGLYYMVTSTDPLQVQLGGYKRGNYYYAVDRTTAQTLTSVVIPENVVGPDNKTYTVTGLSYYAFSECSALQEIHSNIKIPAPISSSSFNSNIYTTATLYIPAGTMTAYQADTYGWNKFTNIVLEGVDTEKSLAVGETFVVGGISYQVTAPFEVMVGAKRPNAIKAIDVDTVGRLEIPASVTGPDENQYTVSSIGDDAFYECSKLTAVTLPKTIASIGLFAFSHCSGLTSITIPASVISLGANIVSYCSGLKSIVVEAGNPVYDSRDNCNAIIQKRGLVLLSGCQNTVVPSGVKQFGQWCMAGITGLTSFTFPEGSDGVAFNMFSDCTDLKTVTLVSGMRQISTQAFEGCTSLASITIPEGVTTIGSSAFWHCSALTSVVIPKSVTSISGSTFGWCDALVSLSVEEGNTVYDSRDNCNAVIKTEKNELIIGIGKTVIPSSVTGIGNYAFYYCTNITSLTIPSSVTSIGDNAVVSCSNLASVTIPASVTSIGKSFLNGCGALTEVTSFIEKPFAISNSISTTVANKATLYVPAGTKAKYEALDGWKQFKNIVEMVVIEPIEGETTVKTDELNGQDLSDNVVDDVYYNTGDGSYDATDGSIVISETTNMSQIDNTAPGSDDVRDNFTGIILRVAAGKGTITVNVKTVGNAQLVVQVGNGTPMIASRTEQGDVVVSYDVEEDTYVYIYAIVGSSNSRAMRAATTDEVRIYGITITPGGDGITINTEHSSAFNNHYFTLDGKKHEGQPKDKGFYIVGSRKVIVR